MQAAAAYNRQTGCNSLTPSPLSLPQPAALNLTQTDKIAGSAITVAKVLFFPAIRQRIKVKPEIRSTPRQLQQLQQACSNRGRGRWWVVGKGAWRNNCRKYGKWQLKNKNLCCSPFPCAFTLYAPHKDSSRKQQEEEDTAQPKMLAKHHNEVMNVNGNRACT